MSVRVDIYDLMVTLYGHLKHSPILLLLNPFVCEDLGSKLA